MQEVLDRPTEVIEQAPKKANPQAGRLQVKISPACKEDLAALFADRTAAKTIMAVAETMGLMETLKLTYEEGELTGETIAVHLTPSRELLERAASYYLPPHKLVRAAALKIAQSVRSGVPLELVVPDKVADSNG